MGASTGAIPAHAGKTCTRNTRTARTRAHPHSREENTSCGWRTTLPTGSSPLTQGKRPVGDNSPVGERVIPAHAGKPHLAIIAKVEPGFIPAHAGKTNGSRCSTAASRAHPRSRGENLSSAGVMRRASGSSPLTWGKTSPRNCGRGVGRFIPVDRGKLICIDEVHVTNWKAPECTGAISPTSNPSSHQSPSTFLQKTQQAHSWPSQGHQAAAVCLAPTNSINESMTQRHWISYLQHALKSCNCKRYPVPIAFKLRNAAFNTINQ